MEHSLRFLITAFILSRILAILSLVGGMIGAIWTQTIAPIILALILYGLFIWAKPAYQNEKDS